MTDESNNEIILSNLNSETNKELEQVTELNLSGTSLIDSRGDLSTSEHAETSSRASSYNDTYTSECECNLCKADTKRHKQIFPSSNIQLHPNSCPHGICSYLSRSPSSSSAQECQLNFGNVSPGRGSPHPHEYSQDIVHTATEDGDIGQMDNEWGHLKGALESYMGNSITDSFLDQLEQQFNHPFRPVPSTCNPTQQTCTCEASKHPASCTSTRQNVQTRSAHTENHIAINHRPSNSFFERY